MAIGLFGLEMESREELEFFNRCFQLMKETRRERKQFEFRISKKYWGEELDMLELMLVMSKDTVFGTVKSLLQTDADKIIWGVLSYLFAKAYSSTSAALTLMRSGFTDDAFSIWCTLHETTVVILIICFDKEHLYELAFKYYLHSMVKARKMSAGLRNLPFDIPEEILDLEYEEELEADYKKMLNDFGKVFKEDYGWASSLMGNKVKFVDLEEKVGLNLLRPQYQLASAGLHPNAYGVFNRLAVRRPGHHIGILAGPSNVGQEEVCDLAAMSFLYINQALLKGLDDAVCRTTVTSLDKLAMQICSQLMRKRSAAPSSKFRPKEQRYSSE